MRTTQNMMSFKATGSKPVEMIPHLSPIGISEYMNVYIDAEGHRHSSAEEFEKDQNGIFSFSDAVQDAYTLSVLGDWDYVYTLSNDTPRAITARLEKHLERLQNAVDVIAAYGKDAPKAWEQAEELASQLTERRGI